MRRVLVWMFAAVVCLGVGGAAWADVYLLKAGDTLDVTVWQDQKLNRRLVVAPDGRVAFPLAGHFKAGGRTVEAVEAELKSRLAKQYSDEIDVSVAIAGVKEPPPEPPLPPLPPEPPPIDPSFYVTGEVAKPGQYFFKTRTNVLQAISIAGGLGPFAADRRIKIRRKVHGVETLYDFDYDAFTSGEDLSGNIRLHSGDVIIVPEKGLFE
jgi:polysaccharide biosynthesis/export protein